jgi:hypothetical protein
MKETVDTLEPVLFTNLSEQLVMKARPSEVIKMVDVVCSEWGLQVKRNKDFNLALKILINQVKNN